MLAEKHDKAEAFTRLLRLWPSVKCFELSHTPLSHSFCHGRGKENDRPESPERQRRTLEREELCPDGERKSLCVCESKYKLCWCVVVGFWFGTGVLHWSVGALPWLPFLPVQFAKSPQGLNCSADENQ
ncbi:hypothetical protein IRJ41_009412 [Triplophysa rosa]|uniref:Uncharacterized protein n=1 Tax=Triplophysa rosa TaxID=992332 RepID=A0A9W7TAX7_TRIRA|nr:hypothetical protein IRJ41_009412 [Triplophysa rosa]